MNARNGSVGDDNVAVVRPADGDRIRGAELLVLAGRAVRLVLRIPNNLEAHDFTFPVLMPPPRRSIMITATSHA